MAAAVVAIAWLSVPHADATGGTAGADGGANATATVTVRSGDSLWSIATAVAPNRDPRAEVAKIQQLNHLAGDTVVVGEQLRLS